MKSFLFFWTFSLSVQLACAQDFAAGKIIDSVHCKADPSQSYALYIPLRGDKAPLPVVYFFDSHGVGALPLRKYKTLADAYGFIFIGSNNSRNGNDWVTAGNIWRRMFEDSKSRLRIDGGRVYTCGFSGGAKVAGYVAIQYDVVKGVIANGAGLPDEVRAGTFPFSFTAIAGEGDMNLTDLLLFTKQLDATGTRHRMILFDGKHEWAPSSTMGQAMAGFEFDAMRDKTLARDEGLIQRYDAASKGRVNVDMGAGAWIKAEQECRLSAGFLEGLSQEASWFAQRRQEIVRNPAYQIQVQAQDALFGREGKMKGVYADHFQQGEMSYWTSAISDLQHKAAINNSEKGMNQRLLAYLSLAFYSYSNQLIGGGQDAAAGHFVTLYKMVDPANSEAWYFSAVLNARRGDAAAAESDLGKAVTCGFRDWARMRGQKEFQRVGVRFGGIEGGAGSSSH